MADSIAFTTFVLYMLGMAALAIRGFFVNRSTNKSFGTAAKVDSTHFLGEQNVGSFIVRMNMVATFVSGYVVVGLPDVGAGLGPASLSFLMLCTCCGSTMNIMWPKIGRLVKHRNYLGPNDFAIDLYNSQCVRIITSFGGIFSAFMVLVIEWIMLEIVAGWLFKDQIDDGAITSKGVVWCLAAFVYLCETLGGMESVALTDAVQCTFLVVSFLSVYLLIGSKYNCTGYTCAGFFGESGTTGEFCSNRMTINTSWPVEPPAYGMTTLVEPRSHWSNGTHLVHSGIPPPANSLGNWGMVPPDEVQRRVIDDQLGHISRDVFEKGENFENFNMTEYGCVYYTQNWWMKYPPKFASGFVTYFPLGALPWGINPGAIHRIMIAKSDDSFRVAFAPVHWFPLFFIMPSVIIGMTVATVHPELLKSGVAFTSLVDHFIEFGGIYAIMSTVLIVSCIASFMSTADSVLLAIANQIVEDFWVGGLQKFTPEGALGGRGRQNLIIGKLISISVLMSSIYVALYTEVTFFQLLNIGFCCLWCCVTTSLMGFFFEKVKSPAIIVTAIGAFVSAIYYEFYYAYDFGAGMPTSAAFCGMISMPMLLVMSIVFDAMFPDYDDHQNKGFMKWDAIDIELDRFGVATKRVGARMFAKVAGHQDWQVVQITTAIERGSTTVVCNVLDSDANVVQSNVVFEDADLRGFPMNRTGGCNPNGAGDKREDSHLQAIMRPLRTYYDTPFGTFVFLIKPILYFWCLPIYKDAGADEPIVGGLPEWAFYYAWTNVITSTFMVFENQFLWRSADEHGVSIMATDKDQWRRTAWLALQWSELFKYGCSRRKFWILDRMSIDEVADWADALEGPLKAYAQLFKNENFTGRGLSQVTTADLNEMGVKIGDRYSLLAEIEKLKLTAEQDLYKGDQYMPEPGVQPFCAGKKSASSHETDVGMASEFDSPLSVDAPGATQAIDSSSMLANTDRQKSHDLAPDNANGSL